MASKIIATTETEAKLREEYRAKGRAAALAGKKRDCSPTNPRSLLGHWWYQGYDEDKDAG